MTQLDKAFFKVLWHVGGAETIAFAYNPKELSFEKGVRLAPVEIPGLDTPLLQFVRGESEKITLELFFDTTESGMGADATSVTTLTDRIYQLVKIEPGRHAPPICELHWNDSFPGADTSARIGNQKRNSFKCVVEKVTQTFTLFSPVGVPLRAKLQVSLCEYKTLDEQIDQLNRNSPDRTQTHVLQRGETLTHIAAKHYLRTREWRRIARENAIEDPRRLLAGSVLALPPVE